MQEKSANRLANWLESDEDVEDCEVVYSQRFNSYCIKLMANPYWERPTSMGKLQYHAVVDAFKQSEVDQADWWLLVPAAV